MKALTIFVDMDKYVDVTINNNPYITVETKSFIPLDTPVILIHNPQKGAYGVCTIYTIESIHYEDTEGKKQRLHLKPR